MAKHFIDTIDEEFYLFKVRIYNSSKHSYREKYCAARDFEQALDFAQKYWDDEDIVGVWEVVDLVFVTK